MDQQLSHNHSFFTKRSFNITLVCDGVSSPANIGSIFRTAEAFGVKEIIFCGENIEIISKRMLRTARATQEYVSYRQSDNIANVLKTYPNESHIILGLEITKESIPINNLNMNSDLPLILVIGEENLGISDSALDYIQSCVHINMYGRNSSMNVATATGIALFEITNQLNILQKQPKINH